MDTGRDSSDGTWRPSEDQILDLSAGEVSDLEAIAPPRLRRVSFRDEDNLPTGEETTREFDPSGNGEGPTIDLHGILSEGGLEGEGAMGDGDQTFNFQEEKADRGGYGDGAVWGFGQRPCGVCACCMARLQEVIEPIPRYASGDEADLEDQDILVLGDNGFWEDPTGPPADQESGMGSP